MDRPLFGEHFSLPDRSDLDARLIAGAALFGVGWGIAGLCPGPAVASLALAPVERRSVRRRHARRHGAPPAAPVA